MAEAAWKWAKRRPAIASLVGAVLLTALGGIAGVALMWLRAVDQHTRAEQNFDLARKAVDDYLTKVSQDLLLKSAAGLKPLRKELLERALRYYQGFIRQRGDDPAQEEAVAAAFYRVGDITGEIGEKPAALEALRRAPRTVRGAVPIPAPEPVLQHWTGQVLSAHRRHPQSAIGPADQVAEFYKQAVSVGEGLARDHPENAEFLGELALGYRGAGLLQQAINVGEKLIREHPAVPEYWDDLARCYFLLGVQHEFVGQLDEAQKYANRAHAIRERLANEHPANPYFQSGLAGSLANLSRLHEYSGRPKEALLLYEQCFTIISKAARDHPDEKVLQSRLARSYPVLAHLLNDNGRSSEALEPARQALAMMEPVAREHPADWEVQLFLTWSHIEMGKVQLNMGHADKAIESFRQAMKIMDKPPELGKQLFLHNMTHFFRASVWALRSSVVGQGKTKLTEAEQAERIGYADHAMEALKKTVAGFTYPGMLKYENEFDVLRPRDDFQALIRELDEKVKAIR